MSRPSRAYETWAEMIQRCLNPRAPDYYKYGGRGITVHRPWQTFANFLQDMGPRPPNHTIARNNNDGDYAPGNCCWATRSEQARKRNIAHLVKIGRRTKCVADWCREFAIDQTTVTNRVHRRGWSWERALTEPVRKKTYDRVLTNANSLAT